MYISVIICTHNRSTLLTKALTALVVQSFPVEDLEIIVVDNNSTDDTRHVTESCAAASIAPIRWIFEAKPGLSHARNTGIDCATGDIVAFMDDDAQAEPGWVAALALAFANPTVAAVVGPVRPIWEAPRPVWLTDKWASYLSIEEFQSLKDGDDLPPYSAPIGTNMAFRRSFLGEDIRFPSTLGRKGESLVSNEELYVCRKVVEKCGRVVFASGAVMNHLVPASRLSKEWLYKRVYWQGRSDALMSEPGLAAAVQDALVCVAVMLKNKLQSLLAGETGGFSSRMMVSLYRGRFDGIIKKMAMARGQE